MSQKIDIRERRYNGADYDTLHPETNINMVLDSSNNSVGDVNGALYGDGNGNIVGAAISNPNLLDNPWFTVNQRGFTSGNFTDGKYTVDRWFTSYSVNTNGTVTLNADNSISFSGTNISNSYFVQTLAQIELNKPYTLSVKMGDNSILSASAVISDTSSFIRVSIGNGDSAILLQYINSRYWVIRVAIAANDTFTIRAVKLELGSVSTLANDVAPNYTTELLKCQRYCYVLTDLGASYAYIAPVTILTSQYTFAVVTTPVEMRQIPTLSTVGSFVVQVGETTQPVNSMALTQSSASNTVFRLNMPVSGFTTGQLGLLEATEIGSKIILSADL